MVTIGWNKQDLRLTSLLHKFGVWPRKTNSTKNSNFYKYYTYTLQIVFSFGYTVGLSGAVFESVDFQEATVSIPLSLSCVIICARIANFYINNASMQARLAEIHGFELWTREEQLFISRRLRGFNKLSLAFTGTIYFCLFTQLIVPLFLTKDTLPLPIWFPLNWRHNKLHFWIVYIYSSMAIFVIGHMVMLLQIFTCYLMYMNIIKFEVLGIRLSRLGYQQYFESDWRNKVRCSAVNYGLGEEALNDNFTKGLIRCVKCHRKIVGAEWYSSRHHFSNQDFTNCRHCRRALNLLLHLITFAGSLASYMTKNLLLHLFNNNSAIITENKPENIRRIEKKFSGIFLLQISCSSVVICSGAYILAFSPPQDDQFQVIVHIALIGYYIFDIFLTMYFGDLIIQKSDDLRVSLYQSNWIQQSLTFRRIAMILFERLQVPTIIRVGKLFPLSLQTFSSILATAYRLFSVFANIEVYPM